VLSDALAGRRARRAIETLAAAAADAARREVARPLMARLEAKIGEAEALSSELDALFEEHAALARENEEEGAKNGE
jgi:hypothetical protein